MSGKASVCDSTSGSDSEMESEMESPVTSSTSAQRKEQKHCCYVIYVTNLNRKTTRAELESHFALGNKIKFIRMPKRASGGFAYIGITDFKSMMRALMMNSTILLGYRIKVRSAPQWSRSQYLASNRQRSRIFASMPHKNTRFKAAYMRSGKFYDRQYEVEKARYLQSCKRRRNLLKGGKIKNRNK